MVTDSPLAAFAAAVPLALAALEAPAPDEEPRDYVLPPGTGSDSGEDVSPQAGEHSDTPTDGTNEGKTERARGRKG